MTQFKEIYEGLDNYRVPIRNPTNVVAPSSNPRQALKRPIDDVPGMPSPVPTSSKTIKKTNVQIPIARRVYQEPEEVGNLLKSVQEGDIVFSMRGTENRMPHHTTGSGINAPVTVRTIESINAELAREGLQKYVYGFGPSNGEFRQFPFDLDGIVNNIDNEDPYNEFKEPPVANVAVKGPCRLDNREATRIDSRDPSILAYVYVALEAVAVFNDKDVLQGFTHRLKRFTSDMMTRNEVETLPTFYYEHESFNPLWVHKSLGLFGDKDLLASASREKQKKENFLFTSGLVKDRVLMLRWPTTIWRLGFITDTNQSPGMVTCHVDVAVIDTIFEKHALPYQPVNPATKHPAHVLRWTTDAQDNLIPKTFGEDICPKVMSRDLMGFAGERCRLPGDYLAHVWGTDASLKSRKDIVESRNDAMSRYVRIVQANMVQYNQWRKENPVKNFIGVRLFFFLVGLAVRNILHIDTAEFFKGVKDAVAGPETMVVRLIKNPGQVLSDWWKGVEYSDATKTLKLAERGESFDPADYTAEQLREMGVTTEYI